jgi:hypothetical protein
MGHSGGSQSDVAGLKGPGLIADIDFSLSLEDDIELVLIGMDMAGVLLSGFQAVQPGVKVVAGAQGDLGHLGVGEDGLGRGVAENHA